MLLVCLSCTVLHVITCFFIYVVFVKLYDFFFNFYKLVMAWFCCTYLGPGTRIETVKRNGHSTTLNQYVMCVMPPGGGKSNLFRHIIEPVCHKYHERTGKRLSFDSYTTAG